MPLSKRIPFSKGRPPASIVSQSVNNLHCWVVKEIGADDRSLKPYNKQWKTLTANVVYEWETSEKQVCKLLSARLFGKDDSNDRHCTQLVVPKSVKSILPHTQVGYRRL